jgi:uncharacterized membrane protein YkoI
MKAICYYFGALSLALLSLSAIADEDSHRIRQLYLDNEIVSLETIIATIRKQGDYKILEVELEKEKGILVYEIELLDPQGRVHKKQFNAKTGDELHHNRERD